MKKISLLALTCLTLLVYKNWLTPLPLSAGDWQYLYSDALRMYSFFPELWNYHLFGGFGGNVSFILGLETFYLATAKLFVSVLGIPWEITEKLVWYFPFLILSLYSSYQLSKCFFSYPLSSMFSSFFYTINSYILMLVGGGQMGVAIAYSLAPLVLASLVTLIPTIDATKRKNHVKPFYQSLFFGMTVAVQIFFDSRIAFITLCALLLYLLYLFLYTHPKITIIQKYFWYVGGIPFIVTLLLNFFWLFPMVLSKQNPIQQLGSEYLSEAAVRYFSFAPFAFSLALLHPYWPENIFGKVGFMLPEYLVLPLFAYTSLLFIHKQGKKNQRSLLFLASLALIGAFLGKGANEPFGSVYLWLFSHMPGFFMFRDPTKWYTLTALSYAILLPFSLNNLTHWLLKKYPQTVFLKLPGRDKHTVGILSILFGVLVLSYLLYLLRPALTGSLSGTFKPTPIPQEYKELSSFLTNQHTFFRTVWVPAVQRYGYSSQLNPAIAATTLVKKYETKSLIEALSKGKTALQNAGVKYVIVPYDSRGELFTKDRRFSNQEYLTTLTALRNISWLREEKAFGKIIVFRVPQVKEHFWLDGKEQLVNYRLIKPGEYRIQIEKVQSGDTLVFSDSFDPNWLMRVGKQSVPPQAYQRTFTSFSLPLNGNYSVTITYVPQYYATQAFYLSLISLLFLVSLLVFGKITEKNGH